MKSFLNFVPIFAMPHVPIAKNRNLQADQCQIGGSWNFRVIFSVSVSFLPERLGQNALNGSAFARVGSHGLSALFGSHDVHLR